MLNYFIADDEEIIRNGLKCIIDWKDCGFMLCGSGDSYGTYRGFGAFSYLLQAHGLQGIRRGHRRYGGIFCRNL